MIVHSFPFLIGTLDLLRDPTGLSVKGLLPLLRPQLLFDCTSAGRNLSLWSFLGGESQGSQLKLAPVEDHVLTAACRAWKRICIRGRN